MFMISDYCLVTARLLKGAIQLILSPRLEGEGSVSSVVGKFPIPINIIKTFNIAGRVSWQKMTNWDWFSQCLRFSSQSNVRQQGCA